MLRRLTLADCVFAAMCVLFASAAMVWLRLDRSPANWDDAWYLANSLRMYDALVEGGPVAYARAYLHLLGYKAPLIAVLPTPVYLIAGRHAAAAYAVNIAAMLLLFSALYALGKRGGSARAGLIAVWAAGTMPLIYGLAHWYLEIGRAHV